MHFLCIYHNLYANYKISTYELLTIHQKQKISHLLIKNFLDPQYLYHPHFKNIIFITNHIFCTLFIKVLYLWIFIQSIYKYAHICLHFTYLIKDLPLIGIDSMDKLITCNIPLMKIYIYVPFVYWICNIVILFTF